MATTKITNSQTSAVKLNGGDELDLTSTGTLTVSSSNDAVTVNSQTSGVTIDNAGTIANTHSGQRAITIKGSSQTNLVITNEAGGTITASGDDAIHGGSSSTAITSGSISINNYGTISTTGTTGSTNGQAIDLDNTSGTVATTITNHGTITAADADAIRAGINATINNYGTIAGNYAALTDGGTDGNDGIDFQAQTGGKVNNYAGGTITGARHGITGENAVTVVNSGTITGKLGSGINIDYVAGTSTTATTYVTNNAGGVIQGTAGSYSYGSGGTSTASVDGDGIDVDYLVVIKNYGEIDAHGTSTGNLSEAITVGGGEIDNYAGGVIYSVQRAITVDDSNGGNAYGATTIYNEGTITGADGEAISITDTYADTVTNKGTINGSIALGGGNDTYNDYAGSTLNGQLDGGTGTDTLNLLGSGTGTFGNVANFEILSVQSGNWTFTDSESFTSTTIASGATLQIGNGGTTGSLSGSIDDEGGLIVDRSGTVTLSGAISGAGTLLAEGGGKLILSGANSFTGGTTINGATVEIASANGAGSGKITLSGGAQTLVLDSAAFTSNNFANVIHGFGEDDKIDLAGVSNAVSADLGSGNVLTVTLNDGSKLTLHLDPSESFSGEYFHLASDNSGGLYITESSQPCYCRGTLVLTDRGEQRVEDLAIGDRLMTVAGEARPVKWIGRRGYSGRFVLGRSDIQPICIKAGALGHATPRRDLWISPHHAMYLEGVLIEAKDLVNGVSIIQPMDATDVEYFHLELDSHDIIVAEGALSESFVDDDSRMMFQNAHEYAQLYPAEVAKAAAYCARRVEDGEELERVRAAIGRLIGGVSGEVSQPEPLQGFVDRIGGGLVEGWAMRPSQPDALNHVEVYVGDELIGCALAEKYREDLVAAGICRGRHGFTFQLPHGVDPSRVEVRCGRTGTVLAHAAGVCLIGPLAA